ncbi:MAG TPA: WD40 repeat domain-containing protein [Jatrophihabitans sp.]|nr:WD40 repeat domain-containing protein [Jatrophihabitans sp.]
MIAHSSPISGVACAPGWIATAGYDNQVILWQDVTPPRALYRASHDHLANQCAFSPDGSLLVTASSDYSARIWSVPELRLRSVLGPHDDDVEMAVFDPAGTRVATASRDHRVRVFDLDGRLLTTCTGHTADVISVEWSADGTGLVSSSDDGTIKRWSLPDGRLIDEIDLCGVETDTVVLLPDGSVIAGNDDGALVVVDADGAQRRISAHRAGIKRLVLNGGRDLLVSLSYDRSARIWQLADGELILQAETTFPDDVWPRSAAFADEHRLVFGTFGSTYRCFDLVGGTWDEAAAPTAGLNAVCADSPGAGLLTIGDAGRCQLRESAGALPREQSHPGTLCNFLTRVGDTVVTGGQLGILYDARTGRALHQHSSPLNCGAEYHRAGQQPWAVVGTYTGEGLVLRLAGGEAEAVHELRLFDNAVKGVAIDGDVLFAVCADTSATWWDLAGLQPLRTVPAAHSRIANGCFSLGGGVFASVGRDLALRIWQPDGSVDLRETPHPNSIKCGAASPDGRWVATGGYHGLVAVLDLVTGTWSTSRPTTAGISSLTWHPARGAFVASSYDGRLYEIAPAVAP